METIFKGRVERIDYRQGTSATGRDWSMAILHIVEPWGDYPQSIYATVSNRLDISNVKVGMMVTVSLNFKTNDYNGKLFQNTSIWKLSADPESQSQSQLQQSPPPPPSQLSPIEQFDNGATEDGLPF